MARIEGYHVQVSIPHFKPPYGAWQVSSNGRNLLDALEGLRWPVKVDYPNVPTVQRRAFERAYQDLLYLQAESVV